MGNARTTLTTSQIVEVLHQYGLAQAFTAVRMAEGFTNASYRVDTESRSYILTVMDNHDWGSALELAQTMNHLEACGLAGPKIVETAERAEVVRWQDKTIMVKTFCEGAHPDPLDPDQLRLVGQAMAQAQADVTQTTYTQSRRIPSDWRLQLTGCDDDEFLRWVQDSYGLIGQYEQLPRSVIHGDLFPDNILIDPQGVPLLIDWETISFDLDTFDLAMMIVGFTVWGMVDAAPLIEGFQRVRTLQAEEYDALGDLCTYSAAVLAFVRYRKNNVKYKGSGNASHYREMFDSWQDGAFLRVLP